MKTLKKQTPARYLIVADYNDGILEQHVYASLPTIEAADRKLREFNCRYLYIVEIPSHTYNVTV